MIQNARPLKIYPSSEYATKSANVANVRSQVLEITPPAGHYMILRPDIKPVIKLYDSGGNEIDADTVFFVGTKREGQSSPTYAPGSFDYLDHNDLTTKEQRNSENAATITKPLGRSIGARDDNESIVIEIDSPDVVDWSQTGTAFEVEVLYGPNR